MESPVGGGFCLFFAIVKSEKMFFLKKRIAENAWWRVSLLMAIGLSLVSCGEKESKVIILVEGDGVEMANPGDTKMFEINTFSNDDIVKKLSICSEDAKRGILVLKDTMLNVSSFRCTYVYTVPAFEDTTQMDLRFRVFASDDSYSTTWQHLTVCGRENTLASLDNYTLYSGSSRNQDAFSLELEQVLYSSSADARFIDMMDMGNDTLTGEFLRTWTSMTGLSFSRFNDFDYETATRSSVEDAYAVSTKYSELRNIQDNDIVLLGRSDTAVGVIKFLAVFDEEGVENDRYLFSLKKID